MCYTFGQTQVVCLYGVIYRSCINLTNGKGIEAPGGVGTPSGAVGALGNVDSRVCFVSLLKQATQVPLTTRGALPAAEFQIMNPDDLGILAVTAKSNALPSRLFRP